MQGCLRADNQWYGSEVTRVSIIGDAQGIKSGCTETPVALARAADADVDHSVPPVVKLFCGLDAMVHALEAASGKNSNAELSRVRPRAFQRFWMCLRTALLAIQRPIVKCNWLACMRAVRLTWAAPPLAIALVMPLALFVVFPMARP